MIVVVANKISKLQNIVELLSKVRRELKVNETAKEICKEYGFDIDIIDGVPIEFDDSVESSAKTVNSHIKLNPGLMDEEFEIVMRYAVHELVHALQHMTADDDEESKSNSNLGVDYLDDQNEVEAFQFQVKNESETKGQEAAEVYVNELVEYHEIPEDKVEDKVEELLDKVD